VRGWRFDDRRARGQPASRLELELAGKPNLVDTVLPRFADTVKPLRKLAAEKGQ